MRILQLEGVPRADALRAVLGGAIETVATPLAAATALAGRGFDAIVVGPEPPWALDLVAALPLRARPAVLGIGESRGPFGLVDRWLRSDWIAAEVPAALRQALTRASHRRRSGGPVDLSTGLPRRKLLLGTLAQRASRADREKRPLSVACLWFDGRPEAVAELVRDRVRRSERCGFLDARALGVLIWGDERAAERAVARIERELQLAGFRCAGGAVQLCP